MDLAISPQDCLPRDAASAILIGRAWVPGEVGGPSVVLVDGDRLVDITARIPTLAHLLQAEAPLRLIEEARPGRPIGTLAEVLENTAPERRDPERPWLLAPADLQALKACGVTFVKSMLERVIEERAQGDPAQAAALRHSLTTAVGQDLSAVVPASAEAERLKTVLIERGLWSQYLEVGIGPYAEVFTKSQPMSAVGTLAEVGIHPESTWNNPEPEVVLAISAKGAIIGACLGNDVNLRDFEGRSALLLGRAKDNNASCAVGPFLRLLDDRFTLDDLRATDVRMTISGDDSFVLEETSALSEISRDVEQLARQTISANHQYPDGLLLFTGTMFAPVQDRDTPGHGFTHKAGDLVAVAADRLGTLINRVGRSDLVAPWTFGASHLMRNLAARGLLAGAAPNQS